MKWEYKAIEFELNDDPTPSLNDAGTKRWELVAVKPVVTSVGSDWKWLALMKRKLPHKKGTI